MIWISSSVRILFLPAVTLRCILELWPSEHLLPLYILLTFILFVNCIMSSPPSLCTCRLNLTDDLRLHVIHRENCLWVTAQEVSELFPKGDRPLSVVCIMAAVQSEENLVTLLHETLQRAPFLVLLRNNGSVWFPFSRWTREISRMLIKLSWELNQMIYCLSVSYTGKSV